MTGSGQGTCLPCDQVCNGTGNPLQNLNTGREVVTHKEKNCCLGPDKTINDYSLGGRGGWTLEVGRNKF